MTLASYCLSHSNPTDFNNNINTVIKILNDWFKQNSLSLNLTKIQFTNFTTKNNDPIETNINYNNKFIPVSCSLTWIKHMDLLKIKTKNYMLLNSKY